MARRDLNQAVAAILGAPPPEPKRAQRVFMDRTLDVELAAQEEMAKAEPDTLEKAITRQLNSAGKVERLAFESDPTVHKYHTVYKLKQRLIPNELLARIAIQDDLVAAIVQARQNQMSAFGRPRPDRFSTGFVIEQRQETKERLEQIKNHEEKLRTKEEIQQRIAKTSKRLMTCGDESIDLAGNQDHLTFPMYIYQSIRNAVVVGRLATEVLRRADPHTGEERFAGVRVVDAATIYKAEPQQDALEAVRKRSRRLLERLYGENETTIDPKRFEDDDYRWVQVIKETPVQAFTDDQLLVHNFYPVPDVELDGYPVTPLDTVMSAVTTHINITTHNKLYFQSGRAARGMLVIQSDEVDESVVTRVRQQFQAQINSVNNAWRMPVFAVGKEDEVTWQAIDSGGRDMEFQYLADANARTILSAFLMSPDELPGWAYLSRGTNNQSLSEGNNEYKLEAARDVGIRPLLAQFEDFLNAFVLPLFDAQLAKDCVIKLVGLDAETAEKESQRLQQDQLVHMSYDEILEKVEKRAVGKKMGGEFPFNPQYQAILDKYFTVGEIKAFFMGDEKAAQDPQWAYVRDSFWFQWVQLQQAAAQAQQQAAQAQAQGGQPGGDDGSGGGGQGAPPGGGGSDGGGSEKPSNPPAQTENEKSASADEASASPAGEQSGSAGSQGDLTRSVDQALGALSKAEAQLPESKRKLLAQQKTLVLDFLKGLEGDAAEAQAEILEVVKRLKPRAKA